jgi:hypothetical protein
MSNITVKELLDKRFRGVTKYSQDNIKFYEIDASQFLEYAKEDSKGKSLRDCINALGNAKRAIECRIDSILCAYCLSRKSEKERWDFPKKIDIIEQIGIVAPDILRKINKKRNELEHRYVKPTAGDVEDARDVAKLFLAYTENLVEKTVIEYGVPGDFTIQISHKKGFVRLVDEKNQMSEQIAIIDDNDGWIEFAKRLASIGKKFWDK